MFSNRVITNYPYVILIKDTLAQTVAAFDVNCNSNISTF